MPGNSLADKIRENQKWLIPLTIFALSFVVRYVHLNQYESFPTFSSPIMDELYHVQIAEKINSDGYGNEPFFRAPLYPYFLAFTYTNPNLLPL